MVGGAWTAKPIRHTKVRPRFYGVDAEPCPVCYCPLTRVVSTDEDGWRIELRCESPGHGAKQ